MMSNSALRYFSLFLCFFLGGPSLYAKYMYFEATGIAGSQIKTVSQGKFVKVLTSGGYVNIRLTATYKRSQGLNFRSYTKGETLNSVLDGPHYLKK